MAVDTRVVSVAHWTQPWLAWLDSALELEVRRLRARYELSRDEFCGLYISDEQVDRLLEREGGGIVSPTPPDGFDASPLAKVRTDFDLSATETLAIVVALAPELDGKYETIYAYLNDDVTRRAPTIDTCLRLGVPAAQLDADARLLRAGLLEVVPADYWRSSAVRSRVPLRRFLTGSQLVPRPAGDACDHPVRTRLERGLATVVLVGRAEDGLRLARALAGSGGQRLLEVHDGTIRDSLLTGQLHDAWIWIAPEVLERDGRGEARRAGASDTVTLFSIPTTAAVDAFFADTDHEVVRLAPPDARARERLWCAALQERHVRATDEDDVRTVARLFALGPAQIGRAAAAAGRSEIVDLATLTRHARTQSNESFGGLASPVEQTHGWSDLVLPEPTMGQLRELAGAIRNREHVFHEWCLARQAGGTSLRALFSGASGTGKTLAAGVIAQELGLDLFRVDLSAVVSKYIGETEKNLERIFAAAVGSNAILFFDEADALFGKRSEVKDAHDRYANVETAYLLQRIEQYDGVMILATNLSMNMDEAFSRRIHFEIEFPLPDEHLRIRLWRTLLGSGAPTTGDIDFGFLARQFTLAGGDIRNIVLSAAFLAAYEKSPIGMRQLLRAVGRHRRRQGKVPSATEFKDYLQFVTADGG
jgi:hypothetical protein